MRHAIVLVYTYGTPFFTPFANPAKNMTTRFIGMKELRQTMATSVKQAHKKNERLIVLRKNQPFFELRPLSSSEMFFESFRKDIEEARQEARTGRTRSQKEVEKALGV